MPFYKRLFDTMSQVIMPLDKTSSDEMSLDKMEVGKMPLDKMSFDKISSGKMPLDGILPSHCSHTSLLTTLSCHTNVNIFFTNFFLLKWANPGLFFIYFQSFQTNFITIYTTNTCEKCPSSKQCRDSNPRPLERVSLAITTRLVANLINNLHS